MTVIRIRCTLNLSPTYLFSKKLRFLIREVRVPLPKYVKAVSKVLFAVLPNPNRSRASRRSVRMTGTDVLLFDHTVAAGLQR